ncbi:Hypothetical protein PENO1_065540 [Penicillium occitanis (nom. inval.)]|nr:Hypothetical protein PENO1_065540 [Penicillium occitanis (nom. inval.)]PCH00789.1 hypothetical protein PENOC_051180 [Penicillium occitanis (nom. inval.)]
MAAVHSNMFEISVRPDHENGTGGAHLITLPLNLIAHIVSWIEDPGDLARMCRTCRLLHYMAIPHLYRNISLTSYDRIRYRDEEPEGWGNASPFSMGLNTLVTRAHASLVQSMTLRGEWNEPELEEHSKVGRVPDSSMMLNISVRAALDRTKNIESFRPSKATETHILIHTISIKQTSASDICGSREDSPSHHTFVDKTWSTARLQISEKSKLKLIRHDLVSKEFCEFLSCTSGLEKLYCVNAARSIGSRPSVRPSGSNTTTHSYVVSNGISSNGAFNSIAGNGSITSPSSPRSPASNTTQHLQLRDSYFNSVMANHGATLRHLILPSRWPLSSTTLARLVHVCPNLEQVAFALEVSTLDAFALLIPFLRKLQAMRILIPSTEKSAQEQAIVQPSSNPPVPHFFSMYDMVDLDDDIHAEKISAVTADRERGRAIKVIGMGWKAWELGDFYYIPASGNTPTASETDIYQPVDEARPVISTTMSGRGSPASGFPITDPARNNQPHHANTRTSTPYVTNTPRSSLGKRARDETSPPLGSSAKPSLVLDSDNVYDTLPTGEKIIWRRRVRPVGWEVLKKWEIWALDSQEV